MRRLNALGREGPILKELDHLPVDTTALYHSLLEECQKNRTPEDRELLRNLLAWLAYTKAKFTVGEANLLIAIIDKENSISVEEELEGRLARLLRISGDRASNDHDDSSENEETLEQMIDSTAETKESVEDATNFLSFQGKYCPLRLTMCTNHDGRTIPSCLFPTSHSRPSGWSEMFFYGGSDHNLQDMFYHFDDAK